jgi:DNA-binding NtrC family response regulator
MNKPGFTCLIVEDDAAFSSLEATVVEQEGGMVTVCPNLAAAREAVSKSCFDLILLDNHLPDGKAYDWFESLRRRYPEVVAVMITGLPDVSEAVRLTRNGLFDYLTKPLDADALVDVVRRAGVQREHRGQAVSSEGFIGNSPAMQAVLQLLRQAAEHPTATVLLTGETGTGKDLAARALHRLTFGTRAPEVPYMAVNCGALPADMFESELFGAEKGAYTGADKRRLGMLAAAQGGTLFLDEIGEVPLASQAKLLRALEGREFRPLGSTAMQSFTGRFVAATNRDLHHEVAAGTFREDLLFRIEVLVIEMPPLRQRLEDLPELTRHLLEQLGQRYGRQAPHLRPEDLAALQHHTFPGNIRELRNILERSFLCTPPGDRWLTLKRTWMPKEPVAVAQAPAPPVSSVPQVAPVARAGLTPIEEQEYRLIRAALQDTHGGIRRAAAQLSMSPQALLRRLEKWPELRQAGAGPVPGNETPQKSKGA